MSEEQFRKAVIRHGMRSEGFMGYFDLGILGQHIAVSIVNCASRGPRGAVKINLRQALAYLLHEKAKHEKELEGQ